ncbi:hypothetical protein QYM36_014172 [Artemia franciscana]|uniref:Monocarboxylate transporter n=1 Tax=Artemia franciscana TaxID=6661 RepID=A0AA88HG32_ARTSF|nr:hypothetical protein QYM36_014172 [Artemia franciscana]
MCNLIVDGTCYTFGVFIGDFVNEFAVGKGVVAWAGSLLAGVYMTVGPFVGALSDVIGIGLGLIYLPSLMLVNFYFEKKRAMATGIAVCGSGFGTFLCAPFAAWLQDSYGWRGAHLIIGGLVLNCCKDPIGNGIEIVKKNSENRVTTNGTQPPNGLPRNMTQPVVAIQRDSIRQNDSMPIIENKFLAPARSISRASFSRTRQQSVGDNHSEYSFMFTARATPSIASSASLRSFTRPLTRKDIFYSGSIKNIPEFNQSQNLSQFRQSMMSIPRSTRRFTEVIEEEAIEEERKL